VEVLSDQSVCGVDLVVTRLEDCLATSFVAPSEGFEPGALLGAVLPVLGVVVIAAFIAFYSLPIRGESPRPRPS
jgi:hypothetical protein